DRKSTRLNSSHVKISYAVFCLKKKNYLAALVDDVRVADGRAMLGQGGEEHSAVEVGYGVERVKGAEAWGVAGEFAGGFGLRWRVAWLRTLARASLPGHCPHRRRRPAATLLGGSYSQRSWRRHRC